ncbi:RecF/RecN/SMC N domain, putative [Fictibacillus macauensis ZFHKF-1]|uniref:Chromosome partition protein Smc n=1 Tax=Fictibacillus macauensis ZFHKF-1 TaxID=1196324 RepID=I8IZZ2_9BACL|nr:chromosome segregation protein SMC [Fictibacillus macauensis]EIT85056.1 RecF/RecN/SMC N domain, putative [Fictibacillus macauensis ZFHKF-1]
MFLKRLDVAGFKSFADAIGIEFVPGVTAVVGPNGSGKSNIADAVRWVLGEQSAKSLRGAKMEDIIFSGSEGRKPLNVAEVTLTLDNEDQHLPLEYNEISVTRRVYRSGDSEYLLNKQQCRLKDIVDLFMDSGLGREAYSIIGQGKIDEILSSKAEDRRKIFEEAAGVLKYKTRKHKAEQKLHETQENLNRVEDILFELEGQVEPLEIQASIAKDYLEKKEELQQHEVALTVYEIEELHTKWETQSRTLDELRKKDARLEEKVTSEEKVLRQTRGNIQALDESLDELQQSLLVASEELEKLEGKREVLKERKKNYHHNKETLLQQVQQYKSKRTVLQEEETLEREKFASHKQELSSLKASLQEEEQRLALLELDIEAEMERLKGDYFENLNEQASVRNEIRYLSDQKHQQQFKSGRLDDEHEQYAAKRTTVQAKKQQLLGEVEISKAQVDDAIAAYAKKREELESLQKKQESLQAELYKAYQFIQQFKSKKEWLESMQEEYQGFVQGVKEVLKEKDRALNGIEGAVAELITVSKDMETALETALGGSMQHVVTSTEKDAVAAIQFLKKKKLGRATFLPRSVIKGRSIPASDQTMIASHPAFVNIAAQAVTYDEKYAAIIGNLLGHIIIANTIEGANELARLIRYRYRIVTLEGDVVSAGGSMTGGSLRQKSNSLLSRQRELEETTTKLVKMEAQTLVIEQRVREQKEAIAECDADLEHLRAEGENSRLAQQSLKGKLREVELEEQNLNERLTLYDREKTDYIEEQSSITKRVAMLEVTLQERVEEAKTLEHTIQTLEKEKKNQQVTKEETQQLATALKIKIAEKEQQVAHQKETLERLQQDLQETQLRLTDYEQDYWLLEEEMNNRSSGEEAVDTHIATKREDKARIIQLITERRRDRQLLYTQVEQAEATLKESQRILRHIRENLTTEEVQVNRLDVELDNRLHHLRSEYALSFEAAKANYPALEQPDESRKKVRLIKLAIEELGIVNLGAIEEYERVFERFSFLKEQQEDLVKAKETLHGVIGEMDEEMQKRFEETFENIRYHFGTVFKELFGGGRADLSLTDPTQLLLTGVDILAQPPGKKLQHLALLSGGERALTAIALLFAILKVRPVPFCILDEVEAALDDANVGRYASFLRSFSSHTQFIVVTHRKGTMEEADVLYGVTMQESGVSKLVSVKLEETTELVEA